MNVIRPSGEATEAPMRARKTRGAGLTEAAVRRWRDRCYALMLLCDVSPADATRVLNTGGSRKHLADRLAAMNEAVPDLLRQIVSSAKGGRDAG